MNANVTRCTGIEQKNKMQGEIEPQNSTNYVFINGLKNRLREGRKPRTSHFQGHRAYIAYRERLMRPERGVTSNDYWHYGAGCFLTGVIIGGKGL